jgi:hypothetical protein
MSIIARAALLALIAIGASGQLTKPTVSPTIPVVRPAQSIGAIKPPISVSPNLSAPSGLSVNPTRDYEVGQLTSIVPEYGHHIEVIERDVADIKQRLWVTYGAAWAIGGILVTLGSVFAVLWKPLFRAMIDETIPRIRP